MKVGMNVGDFGYDPAKHHDPDDYSRHGYHVDSVSSGPNGIPVRYGPVTRSAPTGPTWEVGMRHNASKRANLNYVLGYFGQSIFGLIVLSHLDYPIIPDWVGELWLSGCLFLALWMHKRDLDRLDRVHYNR